MLKSPPQIDRNDSSPLAISKRLDFHLAMSNLNPNGFRKPSDKAGRRRFPMGGSSIEKLAVAAGYMEPLEWEPSRRGEAKRKARKLHRQKVLEQQKRERERRGKKRRRVRKPKEEAA